MRYVTCNNRQYRWPDRPVVVICLDGSEPGYPLSDGGGYIDRAIENGQMPYSSAHLPVQIVQEQHQIY